MIVDVHNFQYCWSVRRGKLWKACRRWYFLYYYAAIGGHDEFAEMLIRHLHSAKRIMPSNVYIRRVLNKGMRDIFYNQLWEDYGMPSPESLENICLSIFHSEYSDMLMGRCEQNHQLPILQELMSPDTDIGILKLYLEEEIRKRCQQLTAGAWHEFAAIPPIQRVVTSSPLFLQINELRCCVVPLLIAKMGFGEFWFVEGSDKGVTPQGADNEYDNQIALMHKFYAVNTWRCSPLRVRSFRINSHDGAFNEFQMESFSDTLRDMVNRAEEQIAMIRSDETVDSEDFPKTDNHKTCENCQFATVCHECP